MARPIILSNGEMSIGFDRFGSAHDFYYPYVGLENHTSQRATQHKIGIFIDNAIHWLNDSEWHISQKYLDNSMIGWTTAKNESLGIALSFQDFIDSEFNVFARNIQVINLTDKPREVKLFMHQAFIISEAADGHDTAQYLPQRSDDFPEAILHYKGKRAFIISGKNLQTNSAFDSYSVGAFGHFIDSNGEAENLDGVWRDAEDGYLSENPVERVQTDSILQFNLNIAAHDSARVHYLLAAGKSISDAKQTLKKFQNNGMVENLSKTDKHWRRWLAPAAEYAEVKIAPEYRQNFLNSFLITKSMMDRRGAVIASTDTEMMRTTRDAYVDCWPRDAANMLSAYVKVGYFEEVRQFFRFAKDILDEDGFFWQMYRSDASKGPSSHAWIKYNDNWLPPIQTDETARTLMLFNQAFESSILQRRNKPENWHELFQNLARPMADFLADYIDVTTKLPLPTYELWEVRLETTTYTTALTLTALYGAADIADELGYIDKAIKYRETANDIRSNSEKFWNESRGFFYRGFYPDGSPDDTIDVASFYGAFIGSQFGMFSKDQLSKAFETLMSRFNINENNLKLPRFENDDYHRVDNNTDGNPWFITILWLAKYQLERNISDNENSLYSRNFAKRVLDFTNEYMSKNNILPEQFNPYTEEIISPAPLSWSHGEFLNTLIDYGNPDNNPFKRN